MQRRTARARRLSELLSDYKEAAASSPMFVV